MKYVIKVGSVTNAQRGAKILRLNGYKPAISRLENPKTGDGCGFVITVFDDRNKVLDILEKYSVRVLGVETQ